MVAGEIKHIEFKEGLFEEKMALGRDALRNVYHEGKIVYFLYSPPLRGSAINYQLSSILPE